MITSASRKVHAARLARCCTQIAPECKVVAGDIDDGALTRHIAVDFWKMPDWNTEFGTFLTACHERGIRTIFPSRDGSCCLGGESGAVRPAGNQCCRVRRGTSAPARQTSFAHLAPNTAPFIPPASASTRWPANSYVVKERTARQPETRPQSRSLRSA